MIASESCAFDIIGAELVREVAPGELISLTEDGMEARQVVPSSRRAHCVFEHIYFSRPDTRLEGQVLQQVRGRMGEILWREAPVEADLVISVPDSGNPAANGFARASGIPQDDGLIKNRYVARTFIQPGQELRKRGLRMKFNPLPEIVAGKAGGGRGRLDRARKHDPPDRGHAQGRRREGGAPADLLAADPPSLPLRDRHVDPRGDDRPRAIDRGDRLRARRRLARLPVDRGRLRGGRLGGGAHCDACFTGAYPLGDGGEGNGKFALEVNGTPPPPPLRVRGRRVGATWRQATRVNRDFVASLAGGEPVSHCRPRLRRRDQPAGDPRPASTGATGSRSSAVASNKPDAKALERARGSRGRDAACSSGRRHPGPGSQGRGDRRMARAAVVDLVVLAGYMELLSPEFVRRFAIGSSTCIPALLPSFPGLDPIGQALEHGVRVTGVTVHFVDEGVDSGPIILQRAIEVPYTRDRSAAGGGRSTGSSTSSFRRRSA